MNKGCLAYLMLCITTTLLMDAKIYYVINAARPEVYVGLFTVNEAGKVVDRNPLVFKLNSSYKTKVAKPYARFDDHGRSNQKFIFSANFHELVDAIENRSTKINTVFYYPSREREDFSQLSEQPYTTFQINSGHLTKKAIEQGEVPVPLQMVALNTDVTAPKGTLSNNEVYAKANREAQRIKRQPRKREEVHDIDILVPVPKRRKVEDTSEVGGVSFHTTPSEQDDADELLPQHVSFHE